MVRRRIFLEEGIGLHPDKVVDVWERGLDDAVIIGDVGKLRIHKMIHQFPSLVRTVCLVEEMLALSTFAKR